jgi:hypothetical protein
VLARDVGSDLVDIEHPFFCKLFFGAEVLTVGEFDAGFEFSVFVCFEEGTGGVAEIAVVGGRCRGGRAAESTR